VAYDNRVAVALGIDNAVGLFGHDLTPESLV
jgi:hypothetical protein